MNEDEINDYICKRWGNVLTELAKGPGSDQVLTEDEIDDLTEGELRLAIRTGKVEVTLDNWSDLASRCGIEIESGYGMHAARLGRHYLVGKDPLQLFAQMLGQV